jgi:outer membrane protein assembly factor BamB
MRDCSANVWILAGCLTLALGQILPAAADPPESFWASSPGSWPSFRGPQAAGVAPGKDWPLHWNGETGEGIRWRTTIPGLAHASPIVWEDKVIVTSAVTSRDSATYKHGLYGSGDASDDKSVHRWVVIALDKNTGKVLWQTTATEGVPKEKRHIKATYANSTPTTDGFRIVAFFGSQGLYALDMTGRLLWSRDLGRLDVGAYDAPTYEWGTASSPILWQNRVFVQVDTQGESFVMALDAATGETLWRTPRDELPSWGTPTVVETDGEPELVTNGSNFIRGYNPRTGEALWRLGGSSKITAPTPIFQDDRIIVASGRAPERPIFAIRPGQRGDLTLPQGQDHSEAIAWSWRGRGSYMPTPLIYQGRVYVLANQGIFDAYDLQTGAEVYRQRIPHGGGGFSGSPVAADGKIYLPGEDGDVFVIRAGPEFQVLATNPMGERLMATPALSEGILFVRGEKSLFAVASPELPRPPVNPPILQSTRVKLETSLGDIVVELYTAKAPRTVENFLAYAKAGHYDNTIVYRIENFLIQMGSMGPDLVSKPVGEPIPNEADNGLKNERGTVGMARRRDPNSATAEYYINLKSNPHLDHRDKTDRGWGYCVFGRVISGIEVVQAIATTPTQPQGNLPYAPKTEILIRRVAAIP